MIIMHEFTAIEAQTGRVLYAGISDNPATLASEEVSVVTGVRIMEEGWLDETGTFNKKSEPPSIRHYWNWHTKEWELPPIEHIKTQKGQQINAWRLAANRGSFTFAGKQIACDELSRSDIDGVTSSVTLSGSLPPGFPGAWKAIDNTYVPIPDVAAWSSLVAAMVAQGTYNFVKAQKLKAAVSAMSNIQEIENISWETNIIDLSADPSTQENVSYTPIELVAEESVSNNESYVSQE